MPSPASPPQLDASINTFSLPSVSVLLTGFDRFGRATPSNVNPSHLTVSSLPAALPFLSPSRAYRARLFAFPAAIRVSYAAVLEAIPSIFGNTRFEYIVHVGQAPCSNFRLEACATRNTCEMKDVDGRLREAGSEPSEWAGVDERLGTEVDVDEVLKRWKAGCEGIVLEEGVGEVECVRSDDAGRYLCDYIYYNSLAWAKLQTTEKRTRVVFLHVPPAVDRGSIERNRRVVEELVHALVQVGLDEEERRGKDP